MLLPPPPGGTPSKNQFFLTVQRRVPVFFNISRHLRDKYFDIVWEYHPPQGPPQMEPPKINFLMVQRMVPVFFDISRYLRNKYFDMVWGYHPLGDLPKWIPQK